MDDVQPAQLAKLLWCYALLEETDSQLLAPVLRMLRGSGLKQLSQQDLVMLYQAHRLLTHGWLEARDSKGQKSSTAEQKQTELNASTSGSASSSSSSSSRSSSEATEQDLLSQADAPSSPHAAKPSTLHSMYVPGAQVDLYTDHEDAEEEEDATDSLPEAAWPRHIVRAAEAAAAAAAKRSISQNRRQRQDVADILEDAGLEAVQKLALDGGALRPDVALLAGRLKVAVQVGACA